MEVAAAGSNCPIERVQRQSFSEGGGPFGGFAQEGDPRHLARFADGAPAQIKRAQDRVEAHGDQRRSVNIEGRRNLFLPKMEILTTRGLKPVGAGTKGET